MKSLTRTRTVGGSLMVTIPIEIVRTQGISEGEEIEIEVRKKKKDFFGALKGISAFTREDRMKDREL